MNIEEFTKVRGSDYTFNQIFTIYDAQFEVLRDYLLSLGDSFLVETFTHRMGTNITTEHDFKSGGIVVYKNDEILWGDEDYDDSHPNKIVFTQELVVTDTIKVVIINSNILQTSLDSYIQILQNDVHKSEVTYQKALALNNLFTELGERLNQKIDDYNEEKDLIEDLMVGLNTKVQTIMEDYEVVVEKSHQTVTYYNMTRDIAEDVQAISGLTPQELVDNEVVLARAGASTLGKRLDKMQFVFNNEDEMIESHVLRKDQFVGLVGEGQDKIEFFGTTEDLAKAQSFDYYVQITNPYLERPLYAYKVNEIHTVSYIEDLVERIEDLEYLPIEIEKFGIGYNISETDTTCIAEMGSTVNSLFFKWTLNKECEDLRLDGVQVTGYDTELTGEYSVNKEFTLSAVDDRGTLSESIVNLDFQNGIYYGVATSTTLDNNGILSLTKVLTDKINSEFNVNAIGNNYIWYCIPTRYGVPTISVGSVVGGFTKVSTQDFINASGYRESYDLYRSDNKGLGQTRVYVSYDE